MSCSKWIYFLIQQIFIIFLLGVRHFFSNEQNMKFLTLSGIYNEGRDWDKTDKNSNKLVNFIVYKKAEFVMEKKNRVGKEGFGVCVCVCVCIGAVGGIN